MPQTHQDYSAGRFQSFDTENGYECELPDNVREELEKSPRRQSEFARSKRPRILGRKASPGLKPPLTWPLYLAVLIAVLIIGGAVWRRESSQAERARSKAISPPVLTPQPAPTPITLPPGSASRWKEYLANNPPAPRAALVIPAPRATLVKLPAPRAQLVRDLPPLSPGRQYLATMPYGLEVLATYRGQLQSQDMLPSSGNQLGDTWVVGDTPWVWIWAPGAARADWIDP